MSEGETCAPKDPDSDTAALRLESEQLRHQALADRHVLDKLQDIPHSGTASQTSDTLSRRYRQTLERRADLLEDLLRSAERRSGKLQEENRDLRETANRLSYKLKCAHYELKKALGVKASTKDAKREDSDAPAEEMQDKAAPQPRKRGAPKGHRGRSRPIPAQIDFTELIPSPATCACGNHHIDPIDTFDSKYIEDIPPVSRIVTHRKYQRGRCTQCGKEVRHTEALHGPPVVIGPNLAVHLTLMNQMGTTFRKLSTFSTRVLGAELSPSGVLGLVNRVGHSLDGSYDSLRDALRQQAVLNGDETGWKIMGKSGYIWCFCNKHIAFFHHDHSRATAVIEKILGTDFQGIVMCDFYAAYNCLGKTQRCLVHLLRDIKKERDVLQSSKLLKQFESKVKEFIEKGLQVQAMQDGPEKEQAVRRMEKRLTPVNHDVRHQRQGHHVAETNQQVP